MSTLFNAKRGKSSRKVEEDFVVFTQRSLCKLKEIDVALLYSDGYFVSAERNILL